MSLNCLLWAKTLKLQFFTAIAQISIGQLIKCDRFFLWRLKLNLDNLVTPPYDARFYSSRTLFPLSNLDGN
jgi:hypothetical protein